MYLKLVKNILSHKIFILTCILFTLPKNLSQAKKQNKTKEKTGKYSYFRINPSCIYLMYPLNRTKARKHPLLLAVILSKIGIFMVTTKKHYITY